MELLDAKSMVTGSVQQLYLFDGLGKVFSHDGFFLRSANNSRKLHEFSFIGKTFGVMRCQLGQLSSQVADLLMIFLLFVMLYLKILFYLRDCLRVFLVEIIFETVEEMGKFLKLILSLFLVFLQRIFCLLEFLGEKFVAREESLDEVALVR
jgi:hypothetical protein